MTAPRRRRRRTTSAAAALFPDAGPQPGMAAQYDDTCPRCPDPIVRGDRIVFLRGRPIHIRCQSGQDDT